MPADTNYAFRYFNAMLYTDQWLTAPVQNQERALNMAWATINLLAFRGVKRVSSQTDELPRDFMSDLDMDAIYKAQCEIAFSLLKGDTPEKLMETYLIKRDTLAKATVEYNNTNIPENLLAGVPSVVAWRYLAPYLTDSRAIRISRAS